MRSIHTQLTQEGIMTEQYAVRTTMKELGLITKYRRRTKKTTTPDPHAPNRADLVRRMFTPAMPTTYLCGDITYLRTRQGWMYLAIVMDLTTRMVVGWQAGDKMTSQLVVDALTMAHKAGYIAGNAVFHSDRGSQYTSKHFATEAKRMDVRLSVGEVGVCWDNAVAESFFSTLKLHLLYDKSEFASQFEARYKVGHFIEVYYNRRRIHSTTGTIPADAMRQFRQRLNHTTLDSRLTPATQFFRVQPYTKFDTANLSNPQVLGKEASPVFVSDD